MYRNVKIYVKACTHMYKNVQICTHIYKHVQFKYTYVQNFSTSTYILACKHMYKNVHVCISMLTYVYECTKIVHPRTSMTYT